MVGREITVGGICFWLLDCGTEEQDKETGDAQMEVGGLERGLWEHNLEMGEVEGEKADWEGPAELW